MRFVVDTPPTQKQFLLNIEEKELNSDFLGDMEGLLRKGTHYDKTKAFDWLKNEVITLI